MIVECVHVIMFNIINSISLIIQYVVHMYAKLQVPI